MGQGNIILLGSAHVQQRASILCCRHVGSYLMYQLKSCIKSNLTDFILSSHKAELSLHIFQIKTQVCHQLSNGWNEHKQFWEHYVTEMTGQNGIQTKTPESLARPCSTNYHFDCHDYILLLHHSVKLYNSFYSVCILFLNQENLILFKSKYGELRRSFW